MCKDKQIVLVGFPGCGKSVIGKKLAHRLNLLFIDLDKHIEISENASITKIFSEKGEQYFREIESYQLKQILLYKKHYVLATGGGTPCFFNNMDLINRYATSIYLNQSCKILLSRVLQNIRSRPLFNNLNDEDLRKKIRQMLEEREPYYRQAKFVVEDIDNTSASIERLVKIINSEDIST